MSDNILVAVRLRPLIPREVNDASAVHWEIGEENTISQIDPANRKTLCAPYKFDRVYGMDYNNSDIYMEVAEGIVESALAGFNGTIFAYGQTSSGKTFTMMGDKQDPGVIPLAIQNIFHSIEDNPDREYLIRVSYMEIYNETITDLLSGREQQKGGKGLTVREDLNGTVYVVDLKEECVTSEEMLLAIMRKGNKNRHVGMTNMNDKSSRSHTIFRLIIESRERAETDDTDEAITVSHLNLVDLAGSENASQTGATGERLKEGGFINKSLFMLGRVISQLSEGEQFVNFRDSKLTRILQSSLGGNAKTVIVCTVTPVGIEQTHSTLRFASRAKSVKNKPIVNEVLSDGALLKRYAREIKNLQVSLAKERNTDRAQEVEQVREMLDEKERMNQELLEKINQLKTKLVVSSHPRDTTKVIAAKKKQRRETWAAPAALRAMRMSMAPVRIEPIKIDHDFLQPRLPRWAEQRRISEECSPCSEKGEVNCSIISDGFGREDSFSMDMAEQSKLGKLETSFDRTETLNPKPWKRVHFKLSDHGNVTDAECQTDESLALHLRLTPQLHQNASTPVHVLRQRNVALKQEMDEKEEWLEDWRKEINDLRSFQKNEMLFMEESFQKKMAEGPLDYTKLEEKEKEIKDLQHSLSDSENLLLDANRNLSQKTQELEELKVQVKELSLKSSRLDEVEKDLNVLRTKFAEGQKIMKEREERLDHLENERKDFDMMMELALDKQKIKEKDLRKSLDDAWMEIAAYEKGDVEKVKDRHQRMSILEAEVSKLTETKLADGDGVSLDEIKQQLDDALAKQQAYEKTIEEQQLQLSQASVLEANLKEMESQISEMEILKAELYTAQDQVKAVRKENTSLREESRFLKEEERNSEECKRIQELEAEVEILREKLEEADTTESVLGVSPPESRSESTAASRISRKLSETLQVLEESLLLPCTPGKDSASFCEPFIQPYDVATIKQQLLALQEALVSQELQYQNQRQQQELTEDTVAYQLICSEIASEVEKETNIWKVAESFYGDYLSHSLSPLYCSEPPAVEKTAFNVREAVLNRKSVGFPDIEEIVQEAVAEARLNIQSEFEQKYRDERDALEARLCQNTFVEGDTLYLSPGCDTTSDVLSMELTMNRVGNTSVLDSSPLSAKDETQSLKEEMEALRKENCNLISQLEQLKNEVQVVRHESELQDRVANISTESCNDSVLTAKLFGEALSLADELREADMRSLDKVANISTESCNDSVLLAPKSAGGALSLADELREAGMSSQDKVTNISTESCNDSVLLAPKPVGGALSLADELREAGMSSQDTLTNISTVSCNDSVLLASKPVGGALSLADEMREAGMSATFCNDTFETSVRDMVPHPPTLETKDLKHKMEILESEKCALQNQVLKLQTDLEAAKDTAAADKCTEVLTPTDGDVKTLEEEMANVQSANVALELEIEKLKDELSNARIENEELHSLRWQVESLKEENSNLEEDLKALESESEEILTVSVCKEERGQEAKLEESVREDRDENVKKVMVELEEIREVNQKLQEEKEALVQQLHCLEKATKDTENLQEEIKVKEEELLATKEELESLRTSLTNNVQEMQEAEKNCKELKQTLTEKEMEFNKMKIHMELLEENESSIAKTNEEKSLKISEKEKELLNAQEKMDSLSKQLEEQQESFESKIASALEEKDNELEALITNFMEKEEAFEIKIKELQETDKKTTDVSMITEDRSEVENLQEKCSALQNTINSLESALSTKDTELFALKEATQKLEKDFVNARKQHEENVQEMKETLQSYEEKQSAGDGNLEDVKKKYEESRSIIEAMEREKQQLKQDLDDAVTNLEEKQKLLREQGELEDLLQSYKQQLEENQKLNGKGDDERDQTILKKLDEFEELKNEHSVKVTECNRLKDSLANLEMIKSKKEEMLSTVNEEHQQQVAVYTGQLEERNEQICTLEAEIKDKSEAVASLTALMEAKETKVKNLQHDLEEMKQRSERIAAENEEMMLNNQKETSDKMKELESEIERLTKLSEEVCDDRKNMVEALNEKEQAIKDLVTGSESQKEQLQNLQEEKDRLQEQCDAKIAEMLQKTEEVASLEAEREKLEQEVQILQEERNQLHDDCNTKQRDLVQKAEEVTELEAQREKMKEEMVSLNSQVKTVSEKSESNNHYIEKLVCIIEKFETDMAVKEDQLTHAMKWESEALAKEGELEGLKKERETLTSQLSDIESTVKSLQCENEELKKTRNKMEEDVAHNKRRSQDLEIVRERLASAENQMEESKEQLSTCILEKTELSEKLAAKEDELERIVLECKDCKESLQVLKDELDEKSALIAKVTDEKAKVSSEMDSIKSELNSLREVVKTSELELLQRSKEIVSIKSEKELKEEEYKALKLSSSEQIEKLVKIVEKFEVEMSEKEQQMLTKEREHENENTEREGKLKSLMLELTNRSSQVTELEETVNHLHQEKEELLQKLCDLEKKEALATGDDRSKSVDSACDGEGKLEEYKNELATYVSQNKELSTKLLDIEEKLKAVEGELQKTLQELESKTEECSKLDSEMDEMVEHYKNEGEEKREMILSLTQDCKKMEEELKEMKEKSLSHTTLNTSSATNNVVEGKNPLEDTVEALKQELAEKEQECAELNKEMDEMIEHLKKEGRTYHRELEEVTEMYEKTKTELSETKGKLERVTLTESMMGHSGDVNIFNQSQQSEELEALKQQNISLEEEISTLKTRYSKLKEKYSDLEEKCLDLEQNNIRLQEEVKIGGSTTDSLLERLGDLEKFKALSLEEKESLSKRLKEYENELEVLKKSMADQNARVQIDELLQKVKSLEKDLEVSSKNFENLAEECSGWKLGYTKQFEENEKLKEKLREGEIILEKQKVEYNEKIEDLTTRLNTVMNKTLSNSSSLDVSKGGRKSKVSALEQQRESLLEDVADLTARNGILEKHLESLRKSNGVLSTVEEFQLELSLMKKQNEELEKERDLLNKNYDLLEKDFEALEKERESQCARTPETAVGDLSAVGQLQRENSRLQEEIILLKKTTGSRTTGALEDKGVEGSIEERLVVVERENNELRFRLRALNAPAEKEVQTLKEELANANAKVTHLKAELRRIQNSNSVDTTICEMKGAPVKARIFEDEEQSADPKFDYSCRSGVVSEVQVMVLQNKVYHLEKEKKKLLHEQNSMDQHVDHYKSKAQEWKDTALKERKSGEKLKKEVELWRTEINKLKKEIEDGRGKIERQQFEIGSQRELIEKLENDRKEHKVQPESSNISSVSSRRKSVMPAQIKIQEGDTTASTVDEKIEESKISSNSDASLASASYLRLHNTPFPSQTRAERLPFAKTPSDAHTSGDDKPLWQSAYKENKDYSKYYMPPESAKKKKDEECKTQ